MNFNFTLKDCLFGGVKVAKNDDPDKHVYSGYDILFNFHLEFPLPAVGKKVVFLGIDINASVHIDNMGKNVLIPGKCSTETLDDTTLTAEAQY